MDPGLSVCVRAQEPPPPLPNTQVVCVWLAETD